MEKYGEYVCAEEGDSSVILSLPHSAPISKAIIKENLPDFVERKIRYKIPQVMQTLTSGIDAAVPHTTGFHDQESHTRIWTDMPRGIVDVNRKIDQVDRLSVKDKGEPEHANGLIWRSTVLADVDLGNIDEKTLREMEPILQGAYSRSEFHNLLHLAYHPFFQATRDKVERNLKKNNHAIIAGLHSFPAYTASKVMSGDHRGNYILGSAAKRGSSTTTEKEFMGSIMNGEMPDMIMITNPAICSPIIPDIVREEFEKEGYTVGNGYGPFEAKPEDAEFTQGNVKENVHFIGLEHVSHNGLEPGRLSGSLEVNMELAAQFRPIYQKIFDRFAALTTKELKTA